MSSLMPICHEVALHDRFVSVARIGLSCTSSSTRTPGAARPWYARHQGLSPSHCHPAVDWLPPDQTTGQVGIGLIARMHRPRDGRCTAGWRTHGVPCDQGLLIDRHRHRLAHFQVAGQHRVVEVEVHRLEAGTGGRSDERIVLEALIRLQLAPIQEPGRR